MENISKFHTYVKLACWQLIIAVILLLCLTYLPFSYFIKSYITVFASSRSNFKIIFFLSYVFTLLFIRYFKPAKIPRFVPAVSIVLATALFAMGAIEQFVFVNSFDHNLATRLMMIDDGRLSSTQFGHIHTAKIVLYWLAHHWLPQLDLTQYDFGLPYASFYPDWLLALHSFLYVAFFILTLYQLRAYDKFSLGSYAMFAVAVFIVLCRQIDGGVFSCGALGALTVYCCVQWKLWRHETTITSLSTVWLPICTILLVITWIEAYYYSQPNCWLTDSPLSPMIVAFSLFMVYAMFASLQQAKLWRATLIASVFTGIFILLHALGIFDNWGIRQFQYIMQKISGDFTALVPLSASEKALTNPNFTILKTTSIGDLNIITARPKQPIRLWQLNKAWGLYINFATIDVFESQHCNPKDYYQTQGILYVLSTTQSFENFQKNYGNISFVLKPMQNTAQKYSLTLSLPACTPNRMELLKTILKDIGIQKSVMQLYDTTV